jgi:hypothetical protein
MPRKADWPKWHSIKQRRLTWIPRNGPKRAKIFAQKFAYANPVSPGKNAVLLTREYETNAHNLAKSQAALAAALLANVPNAALK